MSENETTNGAAGNEASATSSADPLRAAADAMATAVQAARDGAEDARQSVEKFLPAANRFVNRFVYTTCYTMSYGVVFPTMLMVRSIPKDNAIVHGLTDGGLAARDAVVRMREKSAAEAAGHPEASAAVQPA
jgi:hypothetical protein